MLVHLLSLQGTIEERGWKGQQQQARRLRHQKPLRKCWLKWKVVSLLRTSAEGSALELSCIQQLAELKQKEERLMQASAAGRQTAGRVLGQVHNSLCNRRETTPPTAWEAEEVVGTKERPWLVPGLPYPKSGFDMWLEGFARRWLHYGAEPKSIKEKAP
ncbi:hypothetical protein OEZ86_011738 [Tetradesmus obliquus]|nr:hypothetical protein OEZ86_011738 [Tetradesmus obliquus]